ncbi:hypothetical protein WJ75_15420 [Burkholderia ubonensis]|nr:hypothetical protein WJ75_15420 [Burkholderia ubonensis]
MGASSVQRFARVVQLVVGHPHAGERDVADRQVRDAERRLRGLRRTPGRSGSISMSEVAG